MREFVIIFALIITPLAAFAQNRKISMKKELTPLEKHVILDKGTEAPFTGEYTDFNDLGTYHCRQCGAPLYRSDSKFHSGCGWPSFDDEIAGAVKRTADADGRRTEITCASCGGHLGHVFEGEGFTGKNTRHCVNSVSLQFVPEKNKSMENTGKPETAVFAGGCFWGVEHLMQQVKGVIDAESGYMGGDVPNPTYEQVKTGKTGHAEVVKVVYDPAVVTYEELAKRFFEMHDPTQVNRQGPDVGNQYRTEIFYYSPEQKATAEKLIELLAKRGCRAVTKLTPAAEFFSAEEYHQDYIEKTGREACGMYSKRF